MAVAKMAGTRSFLAPRFLNCLVSEAVHTKRQEPLPAPAIEGYEFQFEQQDVEDHIHQLQHKTYQALSQLDDIQILGYKPN
ncbi:hypothetical protein OK016_13345 [Vibrio chagasii]|nr:hypothetical protein [Vibrio chagasii]